MLVFVKKGAVFSRVGLCFRKKMVRWKFFKHWSRSGMPDSVSHLIIVIITYTPWFVFFFSHDFFFYLWIFLEFERCYFILLSILYYLAMFFLGLLFRFNFILFCMCLFEFPVFFFLIFSTKQISNATRCLSFIQSLEFIYIFVIVWLCYLSSKFFLCCLKVIVMGI